MASGQPPSGDAPVLEVDQPATAWASLRAAFDPLCRSLAEAVMSDVPSRLGPVPASGTPWQIGLTLTDDAEITRLNAAWRDRDEPTDVLSFPQYAPGEAEVFPGEPGPMFLGDVVLAFETCMRDAAAAGRNPLHHAGHLFLHGLLHLLGYDHETGQDARIMEGYERAILGRFGIADPYAVPALHDVEAGA